MTPPRSTAQDQAVEARVTRRLSEFATLLREHGLAVGPDELVTAAEALDALGVAASDSPYLALRMALVRHAPDIPRFDELFGRYWHGLEPSATEPQQPRERAGALTDEAPGEAGEPEQVPPARPEDDAERQPDERETRPEAVYSARELLDGKDFADYDDADFARLSMLLERLRAAGPWRITRRLEPYRRGELDLRRTVRESLRSGGEPLARAHARRRRRQRRLTFVCDVSRSMTPYSRAVLHLAHASLHGRRDVEAFTFATRLTRVTRHLLTRDAQGAVDAARASTRDWSGGTRIGAALGELNRCWHGAARGSVVVVASDGWDLGDPRRLAAEAALLQRTAASVVWLNPHLKDPRFAPLTRGMSAALPFADRFAPCHELATFESLVALLDELSLAARSRSARRMILPDAVFGSSSTTVTLRGYL